MISMCKTSGEQSDLGRINFFHWTAAAILVLLIANQSPLQVFCYLLFRWDGLHLCWHCQTTPAKDCLQDLEKFSVDQACVAASHRQQHFRVLLSNRAGHPCVSQNDSF